MVSLNARNAVRSWIMAGKKIIRLSFALIVLEKGEWLMEKQYVEIIRDMLVNHMAFIFHRLEFYRR